MELLSFGPKERLRLVRKRHGSATKLAKLLIMNKTTVTRTLRGELRDELTQARIAKACKVSRRKLFGDVTPSSEAA